MSKPTDRNNYLPFDSAHPYHCKSGLPYSQFLQIRRICSRPFNFKQNCAVKAAQLRKKGYPQTLIREAYAKVRDRPRYDLLTQREMKILTSEQKIYMTTNYNPAYDGLRSQVLKTWDLLDESSSTWQIHSLGLRVGYRRLKSLRDLLVRSKLSPDGDTVTHVTGAPPKCYNPRCRYCPKLCADGHIVAPVTGKKYLTRHNVSCNSNNLISDWVWNSTGYTVYIV